MSSPTVVTMSKGGAPRAAAVRELIHRAADCGWLARIDGRVVVQVGAAGRSAAIVETAQAVAGALRESGADWVVEVRDAEPAAAAEACVDLQGQGGARVRVPRAWFEPFFLITVAAPHPDRRWRIAASLRAQADTLMACNPGVPAAMLLAEAHRLGGADLAIVCGKHRTAGEWWGASSSAVQLEGAVARAAGLRPAALPAIAVIARHELLEPWDETVALPDLLDVPRGAAGAALGAARERATGASRRAIEDGARIVRNLRKVPQALRRRLAARAARQLA